MEGSGRAMAGVRMALRTPSRRWVIAGVWIALRIPSRGWGSVPHQGTQRRRVGVKHASHRWTRRRRVGVRPAAGGLAGRCHGPSSQNRAVTTRRARRVARR
jgi:hypothetical protein